MIEIKNVTSGEEMKKVHSIRKEVFVIEQKCPEEDEFDGYDDEADHFLLYNDTKPTACARVLHFNEGEKIGRVAVLLPYRKKGLGQLLCKYIIDYINKDGPKKIFIHAQTHAKVFYEKLGFVAQGDVFMEDGIEHVKMNFVHK